MPVFSVFKAAPQDAAKSREDVAKSKLRPPTLLFPRQLSFEDGTHRVELHHFGVSHIYGDGFSSRAMPA